VFAFIDSNANVVSIKFKLNYHPMMPIAAVIYLNGIIAGINVI